jgi:ATP-dependent RNA circularization protein (DNA/RNA ligase family)
MVEFFRFPTTPHLAWLSVDAPPRGDKVLSATDVEEVLSGEVIVEEKVDGANLGISLAPEGQLRIQNRGQYIESPFHGQFSRLQAWLEQHGPRLSDAIPQGIVVFGEWCAAKHSLSYDMLPDWLLVFDVYDRAERRFWSSGRRNRLAARLGLATVPQIFRGETDLAALQQLLDVRMSTLRAGPMEGVIVRSESTDWCTRRAKLVRGDFTQAIGEHWSRRSIEWNRIAW